jgi:hypothetical protein
MEIVSIFLLAIVLALVILFVSRPLAKDQRRLSMANGQERSSLLAEREKLLDSLQELDFDKTLGKIPEEDYSRERNILLQKGADVLRRLDSIKPVINSREDRKIRPSSPDLKITIPMTDETLEDQLAMRRRTLKTRTAGFCPNCGKPVLQADTFCSSCGYALEK